jgi:hypothetical protein
LAPHHEIAKIETRSTRQKPRVTTHDSLRTNIERVTARMLDLAQIDGGPSHAIIYPNHTIRSAVMMDGFE